MSDQLNSQDHSDALDLISNTLMRLGLLKPATDKNNQDFVEAIKAFQQERVIVTGKQIGRAHV